ncbi:MULTISPECIES: response regulator [unclassified Acidovorax]|uniref:response regulator n=1 Tax=unclassified Acidovorax TaxID=2684926 RepID=UPI002882DEC4|nr:MULTISPECIES: response regulator [unclassified Acidovorax]
MHPEILIIDDNLDATELLRELLEMQDYPVRTALSGHAALAAMRERPAQLLLVDQNLPDIQGSVLTPQLREIATQAGVPCIAISITGMASGTGSATAVFDHVLGKPLDFDAFDALIARCVSQLQLKSTQ